MKLSWHLFCIFLIGLGIFARFDTIGKKLFWIDEVFTAAPTVGVSNADIYHFFEEKIDGGTTLGAIKELLKPNKHLRAASRSL